MIANKEIMASNIKRLMDEMHVNQTEVCKALGFKQNTFSDWMNAKTYPRIDKIEKMATYFKVDKSSLVEKYNPQRLTVKDLEVIDLYNKSDPQTKAMVDRILEYSKITVKNIK